MKRAGKRAFVPTAERVEERALTTGGLGAAATAELVRAIGWAQVPAATAHAAGTITALAHHKPPHHPHFALPPSPPIKGGLGHGLIRLALPGNYLDYGVITIWNNTNSAVTFGVSVSSYNGGQFVSFTLGSGRYQSYYGGSSLNNVLPVFRVALNPNVTPYTIPNENVVFESPAYYPAGTAGFPYAINVGVNGLFLSYI